MGFKNIRFSVQFQGNNILFPYKLEEGYSKQFIALQLMMNKKCDGEFMENCLNCLKELERKPDKKKVEKMEKKKKKSRSPLSQHQDNQEETMNVSNIVNLKMTSDAKCIGDEYS